VGSRVEQFEEIRRDRRSEGLSIQELAECHKVHRRAVRQPLASALPPPRKEYVARSRPATDPWAAVIDVWLIAGKDAPRQLRHTARRVWQRFEQHPPAVRAEATRRCEIAVENASPAWDSSPRSCPRGSRTAPTGVVPGVSTTPGSLASNALRTSISMPSPASRPRRRATSPSAGTWTPASRSSCCATQVPASPI